MLFVQNQDLLRKLVAVLLRIPLESIQEFVVRNPEIAPEMLGEKFCRLDINMIWKYRSPMREITLSV